MFAICAPCQSFTKFVQRRMTNGREQGREQDKDLLAQTIPFIAEFEPEMVVSETVAGIKSKLREQTALSLSSESSATLWAKGEFARPASGFLNTGNVVLC